MALMEEVTQFLTGTQSVIISTGLLLQPNQENTAISINDNIAKKNKKSLKFVLNKITHPPFVRLYETVLPASNVETATQRLEKIASEMIPFHMNWRSLEETDHLVIVWGELNDALKAFQKAVLVEVNDLRDGLFKQKYIEDEREQRFTDEEEASFKKWGSPWAEPYLPHMVLAKAHPLFEVQPKGLEWPFKHCLFRGIVVGIRTGIDFTHCYEINFTSDQQNPIEPDDISAATIYSSK